MKLRTSHPMQLKYRIGNAHPYPQISIHLKTVKAVHPSSVNLVWKILPALSRGDTAAAGDNADVPPQCRESIDSSNSWAHMGLGDGCGTVFLYVSDRD